MLLRLALFLGALALIVPVVPGDEAPAAAFFKRGKKRLARRRTTQRPAKAKSPGRKRRSLPRWGRRRVKWKKLTFKWRKWPTVRSYSLREARGIARKSAKAIEDYSIGALARLLYILQTEGGLADTLALRSRLGKRGQDIVAQAKVHEELYALPCPKNKRRRDGSAWPPRYNCTQTVAAVTREPLPFIRLGAAPSRYPILGAVDTPKKPGRTGDRSLAGKRRSLISHRDKMAVPSERLDGPLPTQYCVKNKCFPSSPTLFLTIARAVYGDVAPRPVFCAPRKSAGGKWSSDKVWCSGQWLDTLGGWKPWRLDRAENTWIPAGHPDNDQVPPFACVAVPHITRGNSRYASSKAILPPGGEAGMFRCRHRIFKVQVKKAEKTLADLTENIRQMCSQMREQVWGERYLNQKPPIDINREYQSWCRKKNISDCRPPARRDGRPPTDDKPAYIPLSREELLYFFGHRQLYCRADRPGLVHFIFNEDWASSFTCDVPRGLLEAGPFEEGVQTCAIVPFAGGDTSGRLKGDDIKARLHCWKFNRPRCEQVSNPIWQKEKGNIHRSSVFDAYDALLQVRRTRNSNVWSLYDLKDAEKLPDSRRSYSFMDTSKDEGTFGVKDFCRVVRMDRQGTALQCGFTRRTMAQWYEMRSTESPEGCSSGVCARGAFGRGYYCGIFHSPELFPEGGRGIGKPFWMCGFDIGAAGRDRMRRHRAVCLGGAKARAFQSAQGDRSSLQCYERRFLWGESEKSEAILAKFNWKGIVEGVPVRMDPEDYPWLSGGGQALKGKTGLAFGKALRHILEGARAASKVLKRDREEFVAWASRYGHTLGHRTSMRLGVLALVKFGVIHFPVLAEFKKLRFKAAKHFSYKPLNCGSCSELKYDPGDSKEDAVSPERAKELNELLDEVRSGGRAPDDKWFQDFRLVATGGNQLRIQPKQLLTALRLHYVFEILESARSRLLSYARQYRDAVVNRSSNAHILARPELHEVARAAPMPSAHKGNVFCIDGKVLPSGRHRYHCGSSPLLVAGQLERIVGWKLKELKSRGRHRYLLRSDRAPRGRGLSDRIRNQVKFGWCYGGTKGAPLFGRRPTRALSEKQLASPYRMAVPPTVHDWGNPARRRRQTRNRPTGAKKPARKTRFNFQGFASRKKAGARRAPTQRRRASRTKRTKKARFAGMFKGLAGALGKAQKSTRYVITPVQQFKSSIHWLKCAGFQYSDEAWSDADPSREHKKEGTTTAEKGAGKSNPVGGDPRAEKETAKIMDEVGGLLVSVVKFVLPKFGDAMQRVKDLANMAAGFYNKYVKRFVDMAIKVYRTAKKVVDTAKQALSGNIGKVGELLEMAWKAGEKAAGNPKDSSLQQKAAQLRTAYQEAKKNVKTAQTAYEKTIKEARKNRTIGGSGGMVAPMLKELIEVVAKRISATVKPGARNLLSQGFKFVRSFLDPIVQSVISALAGIPFVGAALAAAGQVAYSLAMNYLENAAFDALFGIVERLLAKLIQPVVTPILKVVQEKVLELAGSALGAMEKFRNMLPTSGTLKFSALPPRDRWIDRALACSAPPIPYRNIARDAAVARLHIMRTAHKMRGRVAHFAKDLANRYLSRFGYNYDTWMAAVRNTPEPVMLAQAARISQGIMLSAARQRRRIRTATLGGKTGVVR